MTIATWELTGIPWQEGGRDRSGADCLGILLLRAESIGVRLPDPWGQLARPWLEGWRDVQEAKPEGWVQLPPETKPQDGDILWWGLRNVAMHVSIAVDDGWHLTTSKQTGSRVEPIRSMRLALIFLWRKP